MERERQSAEVLSKNVMCSSDESFLVRDGEGEVRAHVVRETLVLKTLAIAVGPPATTDDMIALWGAAESDRGTLPLVIAIDNSAARPQRQGAVVAA
jgi:hypothetical protein